MDIERSLISKILLDQDVLPAIEARVTPEFFADVQSRLAYTFVLEHWQKYGKPPTRAVFKTNFPVYRLIKVQEPFAYYLDEVRDEYKRRLTNHLFTEVVQALEKGDIDAALNLASRAVTQVATEVSVLADANLHEQGEQDVAAYAKLRELRGQLRGIPTGFPTLDEALSGLQPEQLVIAVGEPKAGKSTLLLRMAATANEHGRSVVFLSFEMSAREQAARYHAMIANLNHRKLRDGRATDEELDKLSRALKRRSKLPRFILSTDVASVATVSGVAAKVDQYRPDIVFVDGVYLMQDEHGADRGTPQALTNLTRSLKRLAQRSKIPIVCSTQVLGWKVDRRQGLKADAIGYSSSFAQDSDVVLGVEKTDSDDLRRVSIVIARDAPLRSVIVHWDWDTATFEEMQAVEEEEDEE